MRQKKRRARRDFDNVKGCAIFLWDKQRNILEIRATHGLSESYLKKGPIDADKSIAETLEGKSVLVYDIQKDTRVQYPDEAEKEGIASILSVPISVKDQIIGVLRIYTSEQRIFPKMKVNLSLDWQIWGALLLKMHGCIIISRPITKG